MSITTRFSEIIGNKIEDYAFHILGCGAIGSSAATQLVRCGAQNMYLYDMDHVSTENIGVSQYSLKDINQPKVFALSEILKGISDNCYIDGEINSTRTSGLSSTALQPFLGQKYPDSDVHAVYCEAWNT